MMGHKTFFVPNRKAKHWAPKTFSDSNPQQKQVNKNKGKNKKMETSDEESSEDDPEVNMGIERVPQEQEKEQEHMRSNPLVLTLITVRICICTGCKVLFTDREWKQPNDLVFRMQIRRQYQKDGKKKTAMKKSNVFFHMRNLGCVHQITEFAYVECDHIYITNKDFVKLTHEHIDLLRKCHYWDYIKRNWQNITKD